MREYQRPIEHPCAGMTLLEMLGYVAALAMLTNICAVAFVQGTRLTQVGESALLRLDTISDVQRDFRQAVRQSVAVESALHEFETGPNQVVLRLPSSNDQPEQTRFIVAGGGNGAPVHITRYSIANDTLVLERHKTYPVSFEVVQFAFDRPPGEGTRTVELELKLFRDRIDNRTGGGAVITAALRTEEDLQ